jgi:cytochrome c553
MKKLLVLAAAASMMGLATTGFAFGNPEKGKEKSQVCAACHGVDGNGVEGQTTYPKLAHQVPGYIAAQLKDFKSGARQDPIMMGMVAALSEEDMYDLDAYYSKQKPAPVGIRPEDEELARIGEKLYRGGDTHYGISACMSCHGPTGEGIPIQYPNLSGQHADYIEKQLVAFKDGTRKNDMMNPIAFLLSQEQIRGLSLYVQGLRSDHN